MFVYAQNFWAYFLQGCSQSVIDFCSALTTIAVGVLCLAPFILIFKFIFKGR